MGALRHRLGHREREHRSGVPTSWGAQGEDDGNCGLNNNDALHLAICNSVAAGLRTWRQPVTTAQRSHRCPLHATESSPFRRWPTTTASRRTIPGPRRLPRLRRRHIRGLLELRFRRRHRRTRRPCINSTWPFRFTALGPGRLLSAPRRRWPLCTSRSIRMRPGTSEVGVARAGRSRPHRQRPRRVSGAGAKRVRVVTAGRPHLRAGEPVERDRSRPLEGFPASDAHRPGLSAAAPMANKRHWPDQPSSESRTARRSTGERRSSPVP